MADLLPGSAAPPPGAWRDRLRRATAGRGVTIGLWLHALALAAFTVVCVAARLHPAARAAGFITLGAGLLVLSLRRLRFDAGTIAIVASGFFLYLTYLGYTEFGERNYDGGAQLDYIKYIVEKRAIPPAAHCFICHHPPAYYALSAGVFAFFQVTRLANPILGVQLFSLLSFVVFVVFGALVVRRLAPGPRAARLATALIVFWPYSFQMSVRVHNDTLACTWMVAALYFVLRWHQENRARDLYLAAVLAALAVLTKSSSYVIVAVLLGLLLLRLVRRGDRLRTAFRALAVLAVVAAAGSFNTFARVKGPATAGGLCHRVLGSACDIRPAEFAENRPYNYLYFDPKSFLREPYLVVERKETGTQLFWNDLVKTSLFATHNRTPDPETAYELNRYVSWVENGLLVVMTIYLLVGIVRFRATVRRRYAVPVLVLISSIAFLMGFRAVIPAPHHNDFRHIFHVLVPMAALYAMTVAGHRGRGVLLASLGRWLAIPFLALSIFYFLPKYNLAMRLWTRIVPGSLAAWGRVAREGKVWDEAPNLRFEGNHIMAFEVPDERTVSQIDVSLDNNDRYKIELVGASETRALLFGPKSGNGLARYQQRVDPPVKGVRQVTLRAVSGDCAYSMGHLVVR
jgi:4-amino-4-deoxy-L-arabinose transferase-like glycosyltransferase